MQDATDLLAPKARQSGLIVQDLEDETLVYDLRTDTAHALSPAAALVFRSCDGETTVREMALRLEEELAGSASLDTVWRVIARLGDDGLLEEAVSRPADREAISRRHMMKKVGVAAAAATITSIVVPTVAFAASCGNGTSGSCLNACTSNDHCAGCTLLNCTQCGTSGTGPSCCVPSGQKPGGASCNTSNQSNCCSGSCNSTTHSCA